MSEDNAPDQTITVSVETMHTWVMRLIGLMEGHMYNVNLIDKIRERTELPADLESIAQNLDEHFREKFYPGTEALREMSDLAIEAERKKSA